MQSVIDVATVGIVYNIFISSYFYNKNIWSSRVRIERVDNPVTAHAPHDIAPTDVACFRRYIYAWNRYQRSIIIPGIIIFQTSVTSLLPDPSILSIYPHIDPSRLYMYTPILLGAFDRLFSYRHGNAPDVFGSMAIYYSAAGHLGNLWTSYAFKSHRFNSSCCSLPADDDGGGRRRDCPELTFEMRIGTPWRRYLRMILRRGVGWRMGGGVGWGRCCDNDGRGRSHRRDIKLGSHSRGTEVADRRRNKCF